MEWGNFFTLFSNKWCQAGGCTLAHFVQCVFWWIAAKVARYWHWLPCRNKIRVGTWLSVSKTLTFSQEHPFVCECCCPRTVNSVKFNSKKTQCMCIGKDGEFFQGNIHLEGEKFKWVNCARTWVIWSHAIWKMTMIFSGDISMGL